MLVTVLCWMETDASFEAHFKEQYPGLVRELRLILGDRALAEDVAADSCLELWRQWDKVRGYDRPGAWLRRVALRRAGRVRWRRGRRHAIESTFEQTASSDALDLDLLRALGSLSEAQRVAIVMHHLGGWPAAEIAEVLSCAEATVRSHLSRGRAHLAALLGESDDVLEVTDAES